MSSDCLPDFLKLVQAGSWVVAILGGIGGVLKFTTELERSRVHREEDLRWRKAQAGKTLNDEMLADKKAHAALTMLDWPGRDVAIENQPVKMDKIELSHALKPHDVNPKPNFSPDEQRVRDAFDRLFYRLGIFEQYLQSHLIELKDIEYPISYYVNKLVSDKCVFETYLTKYKFVGASSFLNRFNGWKDAPIQPNQPPSA